MPTAVIRIQEFDTWRPGYAAAVVNVYVAGTTTLAAIFTDAALTHAAPNPQTLLTYTDAAGNLYGKWNQPLYIGSPYQLEINSTDTTGQIVPPITALPGQDASLADVTPTVGSYADSLADLASRAVDTRNFGALSASNSSANTAILSNAIGAAATAGGGDVLIPPGTWPFTTLTLPSNVVLTGFGSGVTTLQSQAAGNVVTISGANAGFQSLTLDGVNLISTSVGVYSVNNQNTIFRDAIVSRFDTGLWFKGGRHNSWRAFTVSGCNTNAKLSGDTDVGASGDGDVFRNNEWIGGLCTLANTIGVDLFYKDKRCSHWKLQGVGFENSTGTALQISGARYGAFDDCWWLGNTSNLVIQDDTNTSLDARLDNTCIDLHFKGGFMAPPDATPPNADTGVPTPGNSTPPVGGTVTISGLCQEVVFEKMEFDAVAITLNSPQNNIVVLDCTEDENVTISGSAQQWTRRKSEFDGASFGLTSSATPTVAWQYVLAPGQLVQLVAKVIARQRNGTTTDNAIISQGAHCPGATLAYGTRTASFTVGDIVTGGTSGASGRIVADNGTNQLTLQDINGGTFQSGEIITDTGGGSATCGGAQSPQAAALLGSVTTIVAMGTWTVAFAVLSFSVQVVVTGASSTEIEWTVDVDMMST